VIECGETKQRWDIEECAGIKEPVLWEAVKHYGVLAQFTKAIEECAELIKAIAKGDLPNIAEEVADVRIMLDQIEIMLGLDTGMIRQVKLERLSQRISQERKPKDELNCRICFYQSMTREALERLGSDPCLDCHDLSNWKPKEDIGDDKNCNT
jgi:NTP pyrophosphatase (non-canonical NTP hydrolase)